MLISGLQALAAVPLLIAVDQEGGQVARLKEAERVSGYGLRPPTWVRRTIRN